MKKPVEDYEINYLGREQSIYYGDCETNNYSCDKCNFASNTESSSNASGGGWGK